MAKYGQTVSKRFPITANFKIKESNPAIGGRGKGMF
jgi:hypothetical protein